MGKVDVARAQWQRVLEEFPRPGKHEWESEAFKVGGPVPLVEEQPESYSVEKAREALASLKAGAGAPREEVDWLKEFPPQRIRVHEGDPGKNGKRFFAVGEEDLSTRDYEYATRDYLKVSTLCYPSRYMDKARFRVALCDYLRAYRAQAIADWRRLAERAEDKTVSARFKPEAEFKCGLCLQREGYERAAQAHFRKVVEEYPESPFAERARALLKQGG